eukprot:756837-Alexandrium_andersonii.AAC.1
MNPHSLHTYKRLKYFIIGYLRGQRDGESQINLGEKPDTETGARRVGGKDVSDKDKGKDGRR